MALNTAHNVLNQDFHVTVDWPKPTVVGKRVLYVSDLIETFSKIRDQLINYNHRMLKHFLPETVNPSVRAEQIRLLYHQGASIQMLGILTAILCVIMFWEAADHAMLGLWLGVHVVVSLIRLAVTMEFTRSNILNIVP